MLDHGYSYNSPEDEKDVAAWSESSSATSESATDSIGELPNDDADHREDCFLSWMETSSFISMAFQTEITLWCEMAVHGHNGETNTKAVNAIISYYQGHSQLSILLYRLLSADLAIYSCPTTVFREKSPGTVFLAHYLRNNSSMKAFLTKSLEKTLKFLKEAKVEGDATKGVLSDACQLLLNSAEQNLELLPRSIRRMLALLQLRINDKFGRSSGCNVIRSFFFLRIMCPAISMPQQYGLVKSLSPGVTKLLLTVSKILQSCANSDMSTAGRALSSTDTYVRELGGDYNEILRHQIRLMCGIMCEAGETQKKESGSGIRAAHSNKLPKEVSSFFSALPAYQGLQASLQSIGALKPTCLWNSEEISDLLDVYGFKSYSKKIRKSKVTGMDFLTPEAVEAALPFVNKLGHRKKMCKILDDSQHLRNLELPPSQWNCCDTVRWLVSIGLSQFAEQFFKYGVDGKGLCYLSDNELLMMGVSTVGHRKKLLREAGQLNQDQDFRALSDTSPLQSKPKSSSKSKSKCKVGKSNTREWKKAISRTQSAPK